MFSSSLRCICTLPFDTGDHHFVFILVHEKTWIKKSNYLHMPAEVVSKDYMNGTCQCFIYLLLTHPRSFSTLSLLSYNTISNLTFFDLFLALVFWPIILIREL